MADYYKNNSNKIAILQELWYKENERTDGFVTARTNLMSNADVAASKSGTFEAYKRHIAEKITPKLSDVDIVLGPSEESLIPVFWYNTACLDTSNYQAGSVEDLKKQISSIDPKDGKVVVMMMGNIIGKEWTFNHLLNSVNEVIKKGESLDSQEGQTIYRRIYFGLKKRKERVINDIKSALRCGAAKVYLMKGVEEFEILKKLEDRDILQEIADEIKDDRVVYIKDGTEATINFIKINKNNKKFYNTIRLDTANKTTSENASQIEKPTETLFKDKATITFHCGGNFTAAKHQTNEYWPSGQSILLNSAKGKNPQFRVTNGNIYKLTPCANNEVQVVLGVNKWKDDHAELVQEEYLKTKENIAIAELAKAKVDEKIRNILKRPNHGKGGKVSGKSEKSK